MFQVVDNPSAGAHAAAGDDDGRAIDMQQLLMILVSVDGVEPFEIEGVVAFALRSLASLSQNSSRLE